MFCTNKESSETWIRSLHTSVLVFIGVLHVAKPGFSKLGYVFMCDLILASRVCIIVGQVRLKVSRQKCYFHFQKDVVEVGGGQQSSTAP